MLRKQQSNHWNYVRLRSKSYRILKESLSGEARFIFRLQWDEVNTNVNFLIEETTIMTTLTCELIKQVSYLNIEVAEDLKRRVPSYNTVRELSNYFHMLLAQYDGDTLYYRATLKENAKPETWLKDFCRFIVPLFIQRGLPSYTDKRSIPMYNCESRDVTV